MLTPPGIVIDHHVLAGISIAGIVCDVMGGLYLAYDLLGWSNGPLRIITRVVTYMLFFSLGYGLPLGLPFGLIAGAGLGLALGLEFGRLDTNHSGVILTTSRRPLLFALLRGFSSSKFPSDLEPPSLLEIPDLHYRNKPHESQHTPEEIPIVMLHLWQMPKVLTKHTGDEGDGHKDSGYNCELLHDHIEPVGNSGKIHIQHSAHQVTIGI